MADPATDPDAPMGRRHRRDERRRARIRRFFAVVAGAAVFALVRRARHRLGALRRRRPAVAGGDGPARRARRPAPDHDDVDRSRGPPVPDALDDRSPAALGRRRLAGRSARSRARHHRRRHRCRTALLRLPRVERPLHSRLLRLARARDRRDGTPRPRGRRVHHRHERRGRGGGRRVEGGVRTAGRLDDEDPHRCRPHHLLGGFADAEGRDGWTAARSW